MTAPHLESSSTEINAVGILESALHLMCQTVAAPAALLGSLEDNRFRVLAAYGLDLRVGQIIPHAETWLLPERMSLIRSHMLPTFATWINKYLESAVGMRIGSSNTAVWLLNAAQPNLETTHQGLQLAGSHLQTLLETTQELRQLRLVQRQSRDKDFASGIAQSIPTALLVTDLQNRIGFINPALTQLLGYGLQDIYLRNLTDFVDATDHHLLEQSNQAIQAGENAVHSLQLKHANQHWVWLEIHRYPRLDSQKQVIGSVATLRDISQEMQTQERILSIEHDLKSIQSNLKQGSGFVGRLEDIEGAVGLLQMLASNGTDGAIALDDSIIFLEKGRIVATQHPRLEGIEAARAITQRRRGQFQFFPGVKTERASMSLDPVALALEYAKQFDESERTEGAYQTSVTLANSKAAWAFMHGISHPEKFQAIKVGRDVHLVSQRMKIIVLETAASEFKDLALF